MHESVIMRVDSEVKAVGFCCDRTSVLSPGTICGWTSPLKRPQDCWPLLRAYNFPVPVLQGQQLLKHDTVSCVKAWTVKWFKTKKNYKEIYLILEFVLPLNQKVILSGFPDMLASYQLIPVQLNSRRAWTKKHNPGCIRGNGAEITKMHHI